ncbi:hypothetical protein KY360_05435 [Candidatus Woesearchaeota archaeon]|nr:hypothetical protein [Candidatus Woesearchaeota archaeon]
MNHNKFIAMLLIKLILVMPLYTALVFAQPQQQGPSISVTIPRYYNKRVIDITGGVSPYSIVRLYVDNNLLMSLPRPETEDSVFEFNNINLGSHGTTRTIKIVAEDQAGNTNEEEFLITVDEEKPEISVRGIPEYAFESRIRLNGSVNKEVTINAYVVPAVIDTVEPAKIYGLENKSVRPNLVELGWHQANETDFDKYIIYRSDVGVIAAVSPVDYNAYNDVLVNSNETYTYRVAAMDLAGNVGGQSDPLTVTVPQGGRTGIKKPEAIDPSKDRGLQKTITATEDFNFEIELGEDGPYNIRLEATDAAGNTLIIENHTILDTKPPEFEEILPRTSTRIYETYAKEVDIEGRTKPFTKVKIYLNEISGVEDFSTISDSTGFFRLNDVDITSYFRGSLMPEHVGVGELESRYGVVEEESGRHARKVTIYFVAEDRFGRTAEATVIYNIVTCWEGKFEWNARPLLEYQSPSWLSVERLGEGTESIYFFFNFTYLGEGRDARIEGINFQRACDDYIMKDPRYNISCQIMPSSCTAKGNDDNTMQYVACDLGQYDGFNDFGEDDWVDFFGAINNEMIFPFRVTIRYSHIIGNNRTRGHQTFCEPVTFVVDSSKVDFRDVLPDWLLYDAVDSINETITTLNEWQEQIKNVLEYLGIGCVIAFGLKTVATIYRRFVCYWEGFQEETKKMFDKGVESGEYEAKEGEEACKAKQDERNKLSDADLETDCTQCHGAWDFEENLYIAYRTLCDRVFCHDSPARWTENKPDAELYEAAIKEVNQCGGDDRGVKGQPLTQISCAPLRKAGALDTPTIDKNNAGDECYQARVMLRDKIPDIVVFVKEKDSEEGKTGIHHFTSVSLQAPRAGFKPDINFYAKEVEGSLKNSYYTANVKTCEEVCGKESKHLRCIPSEQCLALNAPESEDKKKKIREMNIGLDPDKAKYSSKRAGYTRDCVFGNPSGYLPDKINYMNVEPDTEFPGDTLKNTKECCCVYESEKAPSKFYMDGDYGIKAHKETGYPEWSYRYDQIKFKTGPDSDEARKPTHRDHTGYNPDRYIAERDFAGCFGQNYVLDLKGTSKMKLDPFKDHIATFQCLCVSGVYNRLQLIKNILTAMQNCLVTVRTTGTADTGVCKELFSQYVCSLVWYLISFLETGCLPWGGKGIDLSKSNDNILNAVKGGTSAIFGGIAESAADLASDYGNAQLNNLIGAGEGAIVRKICMAAFGFDWDFDIEDLMDVAYSTPYATLVQAVAPRREYLTYDPVSGQSKYEYRGSWIINPGCDLDNYNVYLSCVSRNEMDKYPGINCDAVNDPEGVNCDCLNLNKEEVKLFYDGRGLKQSILEDTDKHDIITSRNRFDHLKFELKPAHDIPQRTRERCFPEGHENGVFYFPIMDKTATDVAACYVDIATGTFNCLVGLPFFKAKGTGYFVDLKLNEQKAEDLKQLQVGQQLVLTPSVWKAAGPDLCLYVEYLSSGKYNEEGSPFIVPVEQLGTREYPPIIISDGVSMRGVRRFNLKTSNPPGGDIIPRTPEMGARFVAGETMVVHFYDKGKQGGGQGADGIITINRNSLDEVMVERVDGSPIAIKDSGYLDKDKNKFVLKKGGIVFLVDTVTLPTVDGKKVEQVAFTIASEERTVAAEQETKTLKVSLVYLKGDNSTKYIGAQNCNTADKVKYQGKTQEREYRITVKTEVESGVCHFNSTAPVPRACKCDASTNNCGLDADYRYCYAKEGEDKRSCRAYPKCPDEVKGLSIACDCDGDGAINNITALAEIKKMNNTCEGGPAENKYCWSKGGGKKGCHADASGAAPPAPAAVGAAAGPGAEPPPEPPVVEVYTFRNELVDKNLRWRRDGSNEYVGTFSKKDDSVNIELYEGFMQRVKPRTQEINEDNARSIICDSVIQLQHEVHGLTSYYPVVLYDKGAITYPTPGQQKEAYKHLCEPGASGGAD